MAGISSSITKNPNRPDNVARRRLIVRDDKPCSPSLSRTTFPRPGRGRRCSVMKSNTSVVFTCSGALSTTAKNARRSDTVALTVFGRARADTNST